MIDLSYSGKSLVSLAAVFWMSLRDIQKTAARVRVACEQALLFGQPKRASRERARLVSLAQIGELARRLGSGRLASHWRLFLTTGN